MLKRIRGKRLSRKAAPFLVLVAMALFLECSWLIAAQGQSPSQRQPLLPLQTQNDEQVRGIGNPSQQPGIPRSLDQQEVLRPTQADSDTHLTLRQKDALVKASFKATQRDVDRLNQLVQSLRQQIGKSSANVLSLDIVRQAGKIEKLAKKIEKEAKSY